VILTVYYFIIDEILAIT